MTMPSSGAGGSLAEFERAVCLWRDSSDDAKPEDHDEAGVALLQRAAEIAPTGDTNHVTLLLALPPQDREALIAAACRHCTPLHCQNELKPFIHHDALTPGEMDKFDRILRETDQCVSVLNLAVLLSESEVAPDSIVAVGERLIELDELIDRLYSRPDVISVRWHILRRPDGSIPGWLTRAKKMDDRDPADWLDDATATLQPERQRGTSLEELVNKLLGPKERVIRFWGAVPLPTPSTPAAPGALLSPPLSSPDRTFHADVVAGPDGSLALEFAYQNVDPLHSLVGYVLHPGVGGRSVAGFAYLSPDAKPKWSVGGVALPAASAALFGSQCNGVTAGPIQFNELNETTIARIATEAGAQGTGSPEACCAWATSVLRSKAKVSDEVRAALTLVAGVEPSGYGE